MKRYVCKNCGGNVAELTKKNSFKRGEEVCCTTCGGVLSPMELSDEQKKQRDKKNRRWIGSRVFWFELMVVIFLMAIFFMTQR